MAGANILEHELILVGFGECILEKIKAQNEPRVETSVFSEVMNEVQLWSGPFSHSLHFSHFVSHMLC